MGNVSPRSWDITSLMMLWALLAGLCNKAPGLFEMSTKSQFMACPAVLGKLSQKSTFDSFAACWWCEETNLCSQVKFSVSESNSRKRKC